MYVEYGYVDPGGAGRAEQCVVAQALGCDLTDLTENRDGRLTARQRTKLLWRGAELAGVLLLSLAPLIAFTAVLLAVTFFDAELWMFGFVKRMLTSRRALRGVGQLVFLVWAIGITIFGALLGLSGSLGRNVKVSARLWRLGRDLSDGRVARYSGRISTNRSEDFDDVLNRRQMAYFFCTKRRKYEVSQSAYDELEALGGSGFFTIYFTPGSHFLVAAEPASAEQVRSYVSPAPRKREVA